MASSSQFLPTLLLLLATIAMILPSDAQSQSLPPTCVSQTFTANRPYSFCSDLPTLNSYLHWTYNEANSTLSLAFVARPAGPDGWISWAINPTATGMAGSQALVAFKDSTTGAMTVKTFDISSYSALKESKVWYDVKDSSAEVSGGVMRIFATLVLPEKGKTALNHVWQVGPSVSSGFPAKHDFQKANLDAKGNLDLLRGQSTAAAAAGNSRIKKRNIHGVLNVVSWGIMFPVGIIIARYLRVFPSANPAWFYLHVSCQVSAYAIGVAGWGTGLKLGNESKGVTYSYHRNIGITLFALATLQVFALLLRPKPDHKYRFYWNIYHHGVGYAIVILGIINVFKGFDILKPDHKWRSAYIIVIAVLGGMAVFLEAITWIIVLRRKGSSKSATKAYDGFDNGHIRQQPLDP